MVDQLEQEQNIFLSVEEAAKILKTSPETLYVYLCERGKNGGKRGKRIPFEVYVKFGRKTLFIKDKFMNWLKSGAAMLMS